MNCFASMIRYALSFAPAAASRKFARAHKQRHAHDGGRRHRKAAQGIDDAGRNPPRGSTMEMVSHMDVSPNVIKIFFQHSRFARHCGTRVTASILNGTRNRAKITPVRGSAAVMTDSSVQNERRHPARYTLPAPQRTLHELRGQDGRYFRPAAGPQPAWYVCEYRTKILPEGAVLQTQVSVGSYGNPVNVRCEVRYCLKGVGVGVRVPGHFAGGRSARSRQEISAQTAKE